MNILPAMKISQGESFAYDMTVTGQDWTGYTGTATFKAEPQGDDAILTVEATGDNAGLVQVVLTAAETAELPALPRLGWFRTCTCEIVMASPGVVRRFQMPVSVASKL